MEIINIFICIFLGVIIGVVLMGFIKMKPLYDNVRELGQAICEQEYKMDFDYYSDNELACKLKSNKRYSRYDGVTIKLNGE